MTFISIILTPNTQNIPALTDNTINSIINQTIQEYEVICLKKHFNESFSNLIKNSEIEEKFIMINEYKELNKYLKQSQSRYVLFIEEGYELYDTNTLKTFKNMLEKKNIDLLQAKIKYNESSTTYEKYSLKNMLHNSIYNKKFLEKKNINLDAKFFNLTFAADVLTKVNNHPISDQFIVQCPHENEKLSFNNAKEIIEYTTSIKHVLNKLNNNNNRKLLCDFTENLPEIDFDNIPKLSEEDLKVIKKEFDNTCSTISNNYSIMIHYYVSKYFRTFYDMLYNENKNFNILISVIIPTYNVEKYIDDCISSLLMQELENIEIICVDDVSTDSTVDIIRYYERKDKRVKCFVMNEKNGSGGCRNYGLTKAKGKYIQYLDSDDFLDLRALKELYDLAEKKKTQILMYKTTCYNHEEYTFQIEKYFDMKRMDKYLNHLFGIKDISQDVLFNIAVVPWNKLYLKSFLISLNIKFPKNLIHQDEPFFYESFLNADRIYYVENRYHNRRNRNESITKLKNEIELGVIEIIDHILKIFIKYGVYTLYKKGLLNELFIIIRLRYEFILDEYKEEYYNRSKLKILKFVNYYDMYDDLNSCLNKKNKMLFKNFLESENYNEFCKAYE